MSTATGNARRADRTQLRARVAELEAEVARLTRERDDHGPDGRNVTNAQHLAALARVAELERERD